MWFASDVLSHTAGRPYRITTPVGAASLADFRADLEQKLGCGRTPRMLVDARVKLLGSHVPAPLLVFVMRGLPTIILTREEASFDIERRLPNFTPALARMRHRQLVIATRAYDQRRRPLHS